jgi:hypothetical protein
MNGLKHKLRKLNHGKGPGHAIAAATFVRNVACLWWSNRAIKHFANLSQKKTDIYLIKIGQMIGKLHLTLGKG